VERTQPLPAVFRAWVRGCLVVAGLTIPGLAAAHPFEDGLAGHRLRLTVRADSIEVDMLVEEPVPWVLRDLRTFLQDVKSPGPADQERYDARRLDEFATGLQLYVDGERQVWERLPWTGDNGVGDRQFVIYGLRLRAPLDVELQDVAIHLLDANHPGSRVARRMEVWGTWDTDLRGCSLWEGERNRSGQWILVDGTSELRLTRRLGGVLSGGWARLGMLWRTGNTDPVPIGPDGIPGPIPARLARGLLGLGGLVFATGMTVLLWGRLARRREGEGL